MGVFNFEIEVAGTYTVSFSQKDQRMFPRGTDYSYSDTRFFVIKMNDSNDSPTDSDKVNYVQGCLCFFGRDKHMEMELEEGSYYVCSEVDWKEEYAHLHENSGFVTFYGPAAVGVSNLTEDFAFSEIATAACKAIMEGRCAEKAQETMEIKVTNYDEDEAVTFHEFITDFTYHVYGVKNGTESATYE